MPVLLVGDSAGNNVLGYETTVPVTVDELLPLLRAVVRSTSRALIVGDMPFGSYQASPAQALDDGGPLPEGGRRAGGQARGRRAGGAADRRAGGGRHPGDGHVGLTPQSVHALGGYRVQGRGDAGGRAHRRRPRGRRRRGLRGRAGGHAGGAGRAGHRRARHPDHRHRRRPRLRRAGAGLDRHGRADAGHRAEVRQAVRRPARHPRRGRRAPSPTTCARAATPTRSTATPDGRPVQGAGEGSAGAQSRPRLASASCRASTCGAAASDGPYQVR